MSGVDYREYIASDEWRTRRAEAIRRTIKRTEIWTAPQCEVCGQYGVRHKNKPDFKQKKFRVEMSNGLEVHHPHYRNLGCEEPGDLIVLCGLCHDKTHEDPGFKLEVRRIAEERNAEMGW